MKLIIYQSLKSFVCIADRGGRGLGSARWNAFGPKALTISAIVSIKPFSKREEKQIISSLISNQRDLSLLIREGFLMDPTRLLADPKSIFSEIKNQF
jgi:hypothetical protein